MRRRHSVWSHPGRNFWVSSDDNPPRRARSHQGSSEPVYRGHSAHLGRLLSLATLSIAAAASAAPVRVTDTIGLEELRWSPSRAGGTLTGIARDSLGRSLRGIPISESSGQGRPCGAEPRTDEKGRFCFTFAQPPNGPIELWASGDETLIGSATRAPTAAMQRPELKPSVTPLPSSLESAATLRLGIEVRGAQRPEERIGVWLRVVDPAGTARYETQGLASELTPLVHPVPTAALGAPGALIVQVGFADRLREVVSEAPLLHSLPVELSVRKTVAQASGAVTAELSATSGGFPVDEGLVRAQQGKDVLATAAVSAGVARLTFAPGAAKLGAEHAVELAFASQNPALLPGPALSLTLPSRPFSWLGYAPVALALMAIAWLVPQWWRPRRKTHGQSPVTSAESLSDAAAPRPEAAPPGRIVDAHTGAGVMGKLTLTATLDAESRRASLCTRADGTFSLPPESSCAAGRWRVEAPGYETATLSLPSSGPVTIRLVQIRRGLLMRLQRWQLESGAPWRDPPTTPAQTAQRAEQVGREDVTRWATALESAVYGPEEVAPESGLYQSPPLAKPERGT